MSRWLTLLLFAAVSTSVVTLVHYYIWRRLLHDTAVPHPWRRVATIVIVLLGACLPLTMWATRLLGAIVGQTLGWPAFVWMGFAVLLLVGFLIVDGLRLARWSARHGAVMASRLSTKTKGKPETNATDASDASSVVSSTAARSTAEPTAPAPEVRAVPDIARRQFMARVAGGSVLAAASGTMVTGMREALGNVEINEVSVTLSRLPTTLDGFVIAQLSDVHAGNTISRAFIEHLVTRTNELSPDLIAITGDLVDGSVSDLRRIVAPLGELQARHGVYFVTGNHEYYSGVEPWLAELSRLGIRVLRNERVEIGDGSASFDLAGIDDHTAGNLAVGHGPDLGRAVAGRDPERELVLLAHQPRQFREALKHGVGLQLSGHTHGGQIWPWHYLVKAQQGFLAGLERVENSQIFVSRGSGYWGPPVRVGAPAEIAKLVLRAPGRGQNSQPSRV